MIMMPVPEEAAGAPSELGVMRAVLVAVVPVDDPWLDVDTLFDVYRGRGYVVVMVFDDAFALDNARRWTFVIMLALAVVRAIEICSCGRCCEQRER